ncbi:type III pantothenate kinase [Thiohalobacter sp. IOR34]|uniref:type III pantothenate kinase n=1 Tax=Thiohalobacter sp. IOR34 TaxID=3057176 RepID=UPI0025B19973|nr:type III pantothenate kinase [Thiohalobacter sp. IOR34]WJW75121.1 type III pantothenate kinase [Thiohalobacter sp. IOR34]
MILLIDAGNSRLKWACYEAGKFTRNGALDRAAGPTKDLVRDAWADLETPRAVYVANVAGDTLRRSLTAWMKRNWQLTPRFVQSSAEGLGVRNAYADPKRLGVDRWLALVAARASVRGPVCVVDCGTAITIDALSAQGCHLGGLILPGLALMRRSLVEGTEGIGELPALDQTEPPQTLLASDTGQAIIAGTLYAAVATLDRILGDLRAELGGRLRCLLTGGDAEQLRELLSVPTRHEPRLVLKGLARLVDAELQEAAEPPRTDKCQERAVQGGGAEQQKAAGQPEVSEGTEPSSDAEVSEVPGEPERPAQSAADVAQPPEAAASDASGIKTAEAAEAAETATPVPAAAAGHDIDT